MKRILISIFSVFLCVYSFAQNPAASNAGIIAPEYELYPTQNNWTFLELETATGRIWQVQYSIKGDEYRHKVALNPKSLLRNSEAPVAGRFKLKPTNNFYNFLLLDTCTGDVWQVQWSMENKNRGILGYIAEVDPKMLKTGASGAVNLDYMTIEGPHEIVQIIPPSPTYEYYVVELSSKGKLPRSKEVYILLPDGKHIHPIERYNGNKYVFKLKTFSKGTMIIEGEEHGKIEIF